MADAHAASEPETISLIALTDRFIETHRTMKNRAFAFVLGAGASRSSGIKSAREMVADWVRLLYREANEYADGDGDGKDWATAETLKISKYDPKDPAASYSELYQRMYKNDPDRGYAYLEEQMRTAEPSYGYSVLARIMEDHQHKVVVTTNFDNLVADSLSIFSKTYPLVCGHESLAGFISARARRPVVVKVHRDLLLAPKSAPEDLTELPEPFTKALEELFRHYTPIVIGYGGNDGSLMKFLTDLPKKSVPGGVYWCYLDAGPAPSAEIKRFVAAQCGSLVPIPDFDVAMMLIGDKLELDVPDKFVRDRAEARAKRIVEQAGELKARLSRTRRPPASDAASGDGATKPKPEDKVGQTPRATLTPAATPPLADAASSLSAVLLKAMQATLQRESGARRWWQWDQRAQAEPDPSKRDKIYQDAIAELPDSAELLGNYANLLTGVRKDHDKAEEYYKKALAAQPDHANNLGNYATFLRNVRKDHDKAEEYYKKALAAQPDDAVLLGNYADFLTGVRKDHDKAEEHYKKALATQPDDAVLLGNYANFLTGVRKDHDKAEEHYKKALAAQPDDAVLLGNYATFLTGVRKDHDKAEEYYKKSLAAQPDDAVLLGNYANLLTGVRKDHDKAEEYYKKALAAQPDNANHLGNYATFLRNVRKDHDKAEEYYKKALAAQPDNANHLGNYALFLTGVRKDHDKLEECYKKALAAQPDHANNLGNYTRHLLSLERTDEGLEMLQRALAALDASVPGEVHAEVWMYAVCHWLPDRWREALGTLKRLLVVDRITTGDWDFSGVIASARKRGHPDAGWLEPLAKVCAGADPPSSLDQWEAWKRV